MVFSFFYASLADSFMKGRYKTMNENTKKSIEELRAIVMSLYRSAGQLDRALQVIENISQGHGEDSEFFKTCVANEYIHRKDYKKVIFGDLEKTESEAWTKLLESLREEEA